MVRLIATAPACLVALAFCMLSGVRAAEEGWRDDFGRLTHFSGLSCPDRIGALERFEVAGSAAGMLASCTYRTDDVSTVIQLWEPGRLQPTLQTLRENYAEIGFATVEGEGVAARGLSFMVATGAATERRETLWPVTVGGRNFILWMNYPYPGDQARLAAVFTDVVATLRAIR